MGELSGMVQNPQCLRDELIDVDEVGQMGQVQRFGTPQGDFFERMHGLVRTNSGEFFGLNGGNECRRTVRPRFPNKYPHSHWCDHTVNGVQSDLAWGLAYDPGTDTIYALVQDPADNLLKLASLDRTTGAATVLGPGTNQLAGTSGLAFDTDRGVVVAFDNSDDQFWQFDTSGNPTLLWDTAGLDGWGFAYNGDEFILHARSHDNGDPILRDRLLWRIDPYARVIQPDSFVASKAIPMEALDYFAVEGGHLVHLNPGESITGLDFGSREQDSELRGTAFEDLDGDGEQDPGEGPFAGVTIYLDANDNGQLDDGDISTVTDTDGEYAFIDLEAGDYIIRQIVPEMTNLA